MGGGNQRQTLNQLLACMDGFDKNDEVIVIAATNTPDLLDSALMRPGRFDSKIAVSLPDVKGRKEIIELYLSRIVPSDGTCVVTCIPTPPDPHSTRYAGAGPGIHGV